MNGSEKYMSYRIKETVLKKIKGPILCKIGNDLKTFSDGAELAATVFDKSYEVAEITVLENKILISLKERQDRILTPSNWIGEEAI